METRKEWSDILWSAVSMWITATINEARELVDRLREVLASGEFEIRQWTCNIPDVLRHLPAEARSESIERWLSHDELGLSEPSLGLQEPTSGVWGLTMRNVYKVLA